MPVTAADVKIARAILQSWYNRARALGKRLDEIEHLIKVIKELTGGVG